LTTVRSIGIVLFFLFALLQYKLWFASNGISETVQLKKNIATQKTNNEKIITANTLLASQIKTLQQGKASIENMAREELGMIKPGETFYQFVPPNK
jgi:cell division protein FtsB